MQTHFKHSTYRAVQRGPKIIISGAVHGNETCGTKAIQRFMSEIDAGQHELLCGVLTLVPIANPLAYAKQQREGERNLNRNFRPRADAIEFEDHAANWLCGIFAEHEILLDLHSFRGQGSPFVMLGPPDNTGEIEPFQLSSVEEALAVRLGINRCVHGWLNTYAQGVARRQARHGDVMNSSKAQHLHPRFGVGTTEYMRSVGGCGLTLECGQHQDPQAPEVAYQAILATVRHLGVLGGNQPVPNHSMETLCIYDVVDKLDNADHFSREWASFDPLKKGDLIATRADGSVLRAAHDGCILFPDIGAEVHDEWFYLTRISDRLATKNSA